MGIRRLTADSTRWQRGNISWASWPRGAADRASLLLHALRVVITDKSETRKPDRRSLATPPLASDAGARRSVRVTILVGRLGGIKAGCRKLPHQFTCGLAVPLVPPTGPSAGADRGAHFHAAGDSGPAAHERLCAGREHVRDRKQSRLRAREPGARATRPR